ncbi:MAG: MFS transporter [Planctomycetaceae bacterium]|nr:MFS transporter [Planctomycetaceae bacterium]
MTTTLDGPADPDRSIYDRRFWLAYTANLLLVVGNSLTFRFAEFVQFLDGGEAVTGQIVRAGLLGSLVVRLVLGQAIDGAGVRRVWILSTLCFIGGCALFIRIDELGPLIYVARVLFMAGMSSMFACSIYHAQSQVPAHRRTEVIGSLGTSGFIGMIAGTQLGDLLFYNMADRGRLFVTLFCITVGVGIGYLALITQVTRGERERPPAIGPGIHRLVLRYWPGPVVLVALTMGAGFTVTTVFLTRFATANGLHGIGTFFVGYAMTAFVFRWVSRSWSVAIGRHRVILLGLTGHVIGYLLLIPVDQSWEFILPSVLHGFGHALLFPCVVSLGAGAFPSEYRGTGTSIILAFVDLGTMLSAPLLGSIIEESGFTRMYVLMTCITLATGVVYGLLRFRVRDADGIPPDELDSELDELTAASGPEPALVPLSSDENIAANPAGEQVTSRRA